VDLFGSVSMYYKSEDPMEMDKEEYQIKGFYDDVQYHNFERNLTEVN